MYIRYTCCATSDHLVQVFCAGEFCSTRGRSGGAKVLGKLSVPGRPTIWITEGQGPTALAVGAGGGCLDIFTLIYPFSPLSPSLWETARYRLKYCLKGPLNPKQPTNQFCSTRVSIKLLPHYTFYENILVEGKARNKHRPVNEMKSSL